VSTQQPAAGDDKQRPLVPRSRFLARLSRSVHRLVGLKLKGINGNGQKFSAAILLQKQKGLTSLNL
jgi:hypothetical protein